MTYFLFYLAGFCTPFILHVIWVFVDEWKSERDGDLEKMRVSVLDCTTPRYGPLPEGWERTDPGSLARYFGPDGREVKTPEEADCAIFQRPYK